MEKKSSTFKGILSGFITLLSIGFSVFYFHSCGPGNPSEEGGLGGTCAVGKPIKNAIVTVKNSDGDTVSATTGTDGKYKISNPGKDPYLLKVQDGNTILYGVACQTGTANIHPFTNLIIKNWYMVQGVTDLEPFFGSTEPLNPPLPNCDTLNTIQAILKTFLGILSNIIDWSKFDFITTPFTAYDENPVGFDLALSMTEVNLSDNNTISIVVHLSPEYSQTVLDGETNLNQPDIPTAEQEIQKVLDNVASTVNNKACSLTGSDIQPYLETNFMESGMDANIFAKLLKSLVCEDNQKVRTISSITSQWTNYDEATNEFTGNLKITFSTGGFTGGSGLKFGKQGGNWVWLGDNIPARVTVRSRVELQIRPNGSEEWRDERKIEVGDYLNQVIEVRVSGPSLGETVVPVDCDDFDYPDVIENCYEEVPIRNFGYEDTTLATGEYTIKIFLQDGDSVSVHKSILYIPGQDHDLGKGNFPLFQDLTTHSLSQVCGKSLTAKVYAPTWISELARPFIHLWHNGEVIKMIDAKWVGTPQVGQYNSFTVTIPCTYDGETVTYANLGQDAHNEYVEGFGSTSVYWDFNGGG